MFKFALGEKVYIKSENKYGTVEKMESQNKVDQYGTLSSTRYFVNYGQHWESKWYLDYELRREDELSENTLRIVNKVLIDAALDNRNYVLARQLQREMLQRGL